MKIHLSPLEAKLIAMLARLRESYGVEIAMESGVELATTYVLLARMEKRKILTSRVVEKTTKGRLHICRMYKIIPGTEFPSESSPDASLVPA